MPRGSSKANEAFRAVLESAADELHLAKKSATAFEHKGIRGDERAAALANFFRKHLPSNVAVSKGEAIDHHGRRSGQLDLIMYDSDIAAPITVQSENVLVPAESLLAVVEVKSVLSQNELDTCYAAAMKVRRLRPFKQQFIGARTDGARAEDGRLRCLYTVFSYDSDLGRKDWMDKEFRRIEAASTNASGTLDLIDIVYVLSSGMIRPGSKTAKSNGGELVDTFLHFYLHVMNFLRREMQRRPLMDWQAYSSKTDSDWKKLV
jgi:hypothetical protein